MKEGTRFAVIMGLVCLLFIVGNWVVPGFLERDASHQPAEDCGVSWPLRVVPDRRDRRGRSGARPVRRRRRHSWWHSGHCCLRRIRRRNALAFLPAAGAGLLMGAVNGIGVAVLRIPPLVATIAVASVVDGGLIFWVSQANPPNMASDTIVWVADAAFMGFPTSPWCGPRLQQLRCGF